MTQIYNSESVILTQYWFILTNKLVSKMGIKIKNMIQRINDITGNGISAVVSPSSAPQETGEIEYHSQTLQ